MNFFKIGKNLRSKAAFKLAAAALISLIFLAGCGKEKEVETLLTHQPGFSVTVPEGYQLDETLNTNDATTTTWFRADGLALLAIDRQALAGKRLTTLQKKGNKRYLAMVARELERDLGGRLEYFSKFRKEPTKIGGKDAMIVTFITRHEGTHYKSHILLTVQLGEPAHEVMLDFRLPVAEVKSDHTWGELLKSWAWGEAAAGHKKEAESNGH